VGIFRRGKNSDPVDSADTAGSVDEVDEVDPADGTGLDPDLDSDGVGDGDEHGTGSGLADHDRVDDDTAAGVPGSVRSADAATVAGPFDASEVEDDDGRLDLGALRIMGVPGMELRLEIDETANQVVGATAVIGDSAVQIQAFAAPKTMGIWDDIRSEIADSILAQGGTADEARGPLGTELRTRMPSAGPDGRTVFAPARCTGVDGPRWFLRAVFSGRAAIEDAAAEPLLDVVRGTVVVRGESAMAPREMLVLKLPDEVQTPAAQGTTDGAASEGEPGSSAHVDDLKPFERGPEITEVR
jgi:hypothetical protein